jgi:hypothetical protein
MNRDQVLDNTGEHRDELWRKSGKSVITYGTAIPSSNNIKYMVAGNYTALVL